jgi:hypothetical protein
VKSHPIDLGSEQQFLQTSISVLSIAGSPRRRGNTEALLDRSLDGAKSVGAQVEKLVAARLKYDFDAMLDRYYDLRGWSRDGVPLPETLRRLGLVATKGQASEGRDK